jgi:cytochrome oxidase assembly protein ShyY1
MLRGYSFRPRGWTIALAAAGCAAFVALGQWQAGRGDEKRAAARELEKRRVSVAGEFVERHTVLLDNKLRRGRPGYEVLTPLKLAGTERHVLVNRGWVAAGATRDALPQVRTPAGTVRLQGIALDRLPHPLVLGEKDRGRVRQTLEVGAFAAETGLAFEPYVLEEHAGPDDGLAREWPRPDAGAEKHDAYALQWYSLAALALVLGGVFSFRKT